MIYLSKGILPWKPSESAVQVSHCGALHKLTGAKAELWLAGRYQPGFASNAVQVATLKSLSELGIIEYRDNTENAALYRLLTNCVICPVRVRSKPALLNRKERRLLLWMRQAGLRLTMAELAFLMDKDVKPVSTVLGKQNRQELTELIYTTDTIYDGILENLMEKSPVRDDTVRAVLGLLRKKKIYLI
jgi:hypothetical protein